MAVRNPILIRNLTFGIEDSLVSVVGLLAGLATQAASTHQLIVTGTIYVFVEAFAMAVGSYLSEESAEEYVERGKASQHEAIVGACVMFTAFVLTGFIPIIPFLLLSGSAGLIGSVVVALVLLAVLGFVQARYSNVRPWPRALRAAIFGGFAIGVGVVVGTLFGVS